jgi:hypothetical protein
MSLIQRFDPRSFRARMSPSHDGASDNTAKVAKPAKLGEAVSHQDQNFSNFSSPPSTSAESNAIWSAEDWKAYFEERAAIREYDGGLPRGEAERLALQDAIERWLCLNPVPASDPCYGCIYCKTGEDTSNFLVPVLTAGGHVWIHDGCWERWRVSRRDQAGSALRRLGLPPAHAPPVIDCTAGIQNTSDNDSSE